MALRREALHVRMLVPYRTYVLDDFILFCFVFAATFYRTPMPPEAVEITTVLRHFGAIRTPPRFRSR